MTSPSLPANGTSTRPYLIRALHDWCTDNGFTPYVAVFVDGRVQVPLEYVKNNEIVLNIGFEATTALKLGNDFIEFKARFGGTSRDIQVPVDHVIAIYARENGQGMAFPVPTEAGQQGAPAQAGQDKEEGAAAARVGGGLRLASVEDAAAQETAESPDPAKPEPDGPPPEGPAPTGRPALKRIK